MIKVTASGIHIPCLNNGVAQFGRTETLHPRNGKCPVCVIFFVKFHFQLFYFDAAQLLVLPIQHEDGGRISRASFRQIAGDDSNILTNALEGGFDALNEEFARELASYLCPAPCANPFHSHPGRAPERLRGYIDSHPLHR